MDMNGIIARLTLLAAVCGVLVSTAYALTRSNIDKNRADYEARQLQSVAGKHVYNIRQIDKARYALRGNDGKLAGFIFDVSTEQGYNGHIGLWVATDLSGTILGVRVKAHHETPGLGDKIDLDVSPWILSFDGTSLALGDKAWNVKKDGGDFDQFTGATITPRAVVHAVHDGLSTFEARRAQWIEEARHEL